MEPSSQCLALIKRCEGVRHQAYQDSVGIWTIGVGHTGPDVHRGLTWTDVQVDAALASDVAVAARGVALAIGSVATTQAQFDAMTSLAFNVGLANFRRSSVLSNHLRGKPDLAAISFKLWNKAGGKVLAGLVSRRAAEAKLYLS